MTPATIGRKLSAKHGPVEAYWMANRRALGYLVGRDSVRLAFWQAVRAMCYQLGGAGQWT